MLEEKLYQTKTKELIPVYGMFKYLSRMIGNLEKESKKENGHATEFLIRGCPHALILGIYHGYMIEVIDVIYHTFLD